MKTLAFSVIMSLAFLSGCGTNERDDLGTERQQTLAALKPVEYLRSGGIGGIEERISIRADGQIHVEGRLNGTGDGKLNEFQMMQLARAFEGWEKLDSTYAPAANVPAGNKTEVRYGEKTITVSDGAADVPEVFKRARQRVESLARDVPTKL